jgi:hypothetical protein
MRKSINYKIDQVRVPFQLLFVVAVVLLAYYPSQFGELISIDDSRMVEMIQGSPADLKGIFTPGMKDGVYYRPIIAISYFLDKYVWGMSTPIMRLENVLLHTFNALLVYLLAYTVLADSGNRRRELISLVAALLFGLHPINTESVNWISGRTDILACTFILLATLSLVKFIKTGHYAHLALSALFMIAGFLTKEVALAFLPGAFLLTMARYHTSAVPESRRTSPLQENFSPLIAFIGVILFFFLLRSSGIATNDESRIGMTLKVMFSDIAETTLLFLRTFGFYVKKLLYPFPLNFAIVEIDPLYEIVAVPLLLSCLLLVRRDIVAALFSTGIILIAPAFLIALDNIAWTPYAERYLYIPSAFIIVAGVIQGTKLMEHLNWSFMVRKILVISLLLVLLVATFVRTVVWTKNINLFKDTVEKSPTFYVIKSSYAFALVEKGDFELARLQFELANKYNESKIRFRTENKLYKLRYWDEPDFGLAYLLERQGKLKASAAAYEQIWLSSHEKSDRALNRLVSIYLVLLANPENKREENLKKKLLLYGEKLYNMDHDPNRSYWIGKSLLIRGEPREAKKFFLRAVDEYDDGQAYKEIARKYLKRL